MVFSAGWKSKRRLAMMNPMPTGKEATTVEGQTWIAQDRPREPANASLLYEDILYLTPAGGPAPPRTLSTEEWGARLHIERLISELIRDGISICRRDCIPTRLK